MAQTSPCVVGNATAGGEENAARVNDAAAGGEVVRETSSQREASTLERSASRLAGFAPESQITREEMVEAGRSVAEVNAMLVRQHQNEVLQTHFMRWILCSVVVWLLITAVGVALQIWVFMTFVGSKDVKCKVPLRLWVQILILLWAIRFAGTFIDRCICCWHPDPERQQGPPRRIVLKNTLLAVFDFVWVVILGLNWIVSDGQGGDDDLPTCQQLYPKLYAASKGYIAFHLASVAYVWLNVIGLRQMLVIMLRRGLLTTSSAAPPGAFEKNTTVIKVSEVNLEENPSCPVCMEDYSESVAICKTKACSHVFHKQCLQNWLKTARTCPICRHDLGEMSAAPSPSRGE